MLTLTIRTSPDAPPRSIVLDRDRVTLGRSARCDVQIPSATISSHHLTFERRPGAVVVMDHGSTNGTTLNGTPLVPGVFTTIHSGATLRIVDIALTLTAQRAQAEGSFTLAQSDTLVRELIGDALREEAVDDQPYFTRRDTPDGPRLRFPPNTAEAWLTPNGALTIAASPDAAHMTRGAGLWSIHPPEQGELRVEGVLLDRPLSLNTRTELQLGAAWLIFIDPLQDYLNELEPPAPIAPPPTAQAEAVTPRPDPVDATVEASSHTDLTPHTDPPEAADDPTPHTANTPKRGWTATDWALVGLVTLCLLASAGIVLWMFV